MKKIILFMLGVTLFGTAVFATDYVFEVGTYDNNPINVSAGVFYGNTLIIPNSFEGGITEYIIYPDTEEENFWRELQKLGTTGTNVLETWTGAFDGVNAIGLDSIELSNGMFMLGVRNNTGVTAVIDSQQNTYSKFTGGLAFVTPYYLESPIRTFTISGRLVPLQNIVNIYINNVFSRTYGQSDLYLSGRYIQNIVGDYTQLNSSTYRAYKEL